MTVVVGGGDSGLQEALTLAEHAARVIILEQSAALTGQAVYRDRVTAHPKIEVRCNTTVEDVLGDDKVSAVRIRDMTAGTASDLEAAGVFVYTGLKPNTALVQGQLGFDATGAIATDASMRTALKGLFAAGTVRSGSPGRAVSAAGDGTVAAIAIDRYLADGSWR
jgi:thioredoxin reductase (NADPH)